MYRKAMITLFVQEYNPLTPSFYNQVINNLQFHMPLRTLWLPYCSWLLSQIYQVSNWQNSLSLCHQKSSHVLAWYEKYPPDQNFRDGYNLYARLRDYRDDHLYFLSHPEIDYTNNISERQLRKFKRKQKQAVVLRSDTGGQHICDALTIIETAKMQKRNVYDAVESAFTK